MLLSAGFFRSEYRGNALEPWHRELFFESVRVVPDGGNVEQSTRTQASL